eukprot:jgi/Tetstr1/445838/TSEL_033478.t1
MAGAGEPPPSSPGTADPLAPLLPWLSGTGGPLGAQLLEALRGEGHAVLRGVLAPGECAREVAALWDFVEVVSHVVSRRDDNTWFPAARGGVDLWPHSGPGAGPDACRSFQAGWVLRRLREAVAQRVFEPLFGTRELHCSKEGFVFARPTAGGRHPQHPPGAPRSRHPLGRLTPPGTPEQPPEARPQPEAQCCIRAAVALTDTAEPGSCGVVLWPGRRSCGIANGAPGDVQDGGAQRVSLAAGDVLLWRSDVAAALEGPGAEWPSLGALAMVTMAPAALTPTTAAAAKVAAYLSAATGDHRPHAEAWWPPPPPERALVARGALFPPGSPPPLTWRQAELHGVVRYASQAGYHSPAAERAAAEAAGVRFASEEEAEAGGGGAAAVVGSAAQLETLAPGAAPLLGQDKWLGGMASPCGRYVFGVPGSAGRVLRVDVASGGVDLIGPHFHGKFKWLRGVEVPAEVMGVEDFPAGACFALPSNHDAVLRIDPATGGVTTIGGPFKGDWLWHGGNLASDGCIYGIPANAERVLRINPRTSEVALIGPTFSGRQKWYGGIVASNGAIYGIPHTATGVLKIVPSTGECTVVGEGRLPAGGWKWHGGLATDDGELIYGFPNNADAVLKVDTRIDEVSLLDGGGSVLASGRHRVPQDGRYKYLGGAVAADGCVYVFPCDAERVLRIDPRTDELRCIGPLLLEGENKWQNGFRAHDGCVYAIPQRSRHVLRIVPPVAAQSAAPTDATDAAVELLDCGDAFTGCKDKFEGGVMGADGCIYCIPLRAKRVLKIEPAAAVPGCVPSNEQ